MSIAFISCLIIMVGVFLSVVFWPWLSSVENESKKKFPHENLSHYYSLLQEREYMFENLKDIQLDYQMEKLAPKDYDHLYKKLMQEASILIDKIEQIESRHPILLEIEEDLKALEKQTVK